MLQHVQILEASVGMALANFQLACAMPKVDWTCTERT